MKKVKRTLTIRLLTRVAIELIIFLSAIIIIFFIAQLILSKIVWYGDEPFYPLFHHINDQKIYIFVILGFIGLVIIFIHSWLKTLGYLEEIVNATQNMHNNQNNLIELPTELKEIENELNKIKLSLIEKENIAKEAEQRKNDLVVYLAHDLKTPLTSVIGYLTLLCDEQQISPELRNKYLHISLQKAERLEDLINEFFDITRLNLSKLILEPSKVNLTRMFEQLTFEFTPLFTDKKLKCELHAPSDLMIECDVAKMGRVFDNLLRNAVNYSYENSTIMITISNHEDQISIKFQNHGNTIPQEKLMRIFEQFYRLDSARSSESGAGIGLTVAKEIIELHHGTIMASSENQIISFDVTLPFS